MRLLLRSLLLALFAITFTSSNVFSQTATITTDQPDYAPGSTVIITGSGWQPGETVTLQVLHDPTGGDDATSLAHQPWTVVADGSGNVSSTWLVPGDADELGATLKLTAVGGSSGLSAAWTFTDASAPKITSATPLTGPIGQTVTIGLNQNATSITSVFFGTVQSTVVSFSTVNPTTLTAEAPYGTGTVSITVNGYWDNKGTSTAFTDTYNKDYSYTCASPSISTPQPANQPITYGANASFSVVAAGDGLTYQWQEYNGSWSNISNGGIYSNATTATLNLIKPSVSLDGRRYRCVVTGTCGSATTDGTATLTVSARPVEITADAKTKVYGDSDPALTYQITSGSLVSGDNFTGSLSRDAGENVGQYDITQGTVALNSNYTLTYVGAKLAITARPVEITADIKTKVYGDSDPALTYQITSGSLAFTDAFTGSLTRDAGENVGQYDITQGTVALNSNYTLTYVGAKLAITARPVEITADIKTKVYGDSDPALTYQITSGSLAFTDAFTGSLTRDAGENVGQYDITQGTVALNSNYTLTYVGAKLAITARPVEITADIKTKVYGDSDPALTYQITSGSLAFTDAFTGSLTRDAGENVGQYDITQGTVALNSNYTLTYVGAKLAITARPVEITADTKTKVYGDSDPALTYQITSGSLAFTDAFTGSLTRDAGENVGQYDITQGTVALNSNYTLTYVGAKLAITARPVEITADIKTKVYGDSDPALTYQITSGSLAFTDAFTGSLTRDAGENVGQYDITQGTVALNSNYTLTYVGAKLTITQLSITVTADAKSKYCGQADPPLTYISSPSVGTVLPNGSIISFTGALARNPGENSVSPNNMFAILQGTLTDLNNPNYNITFIGANLTINGVSIDASATSTAIPKGTLNKQLSALVTSGGVNVGNASVTFTVTTNVNNIVSNVGGTPVTVTTDPSNPSSGVAIYNLSTGSLLVGLYAVNAAVGSGCASTISYFSVYDPNAGFVTGGGWITSPLVDEGTCLTCKFMRVSGKANFGFNSQYKKGSTVPDGNTEFQFQAGNLNFKSTMYMDGSLVITGGGKAIYKGSGTINGVAGYDFMVSAIDGSIAGGSDRFRIKIWESSSGTIVYDNNYGAADNADPTTDYTLLGGGSIVIHTPNGKKSRVMSSNITSSPVEVNSTQVPNQTGTGPLTVKISPNPTSYYFTAGLQSLSKENVSLVVTDITGRVVEQRTNISANSTIQLGNSYHPGIYIAQFLQGTDKVTLRLIKEGR